MAGDGAVLDVLSVSSMLADTHLPTNELVVADRTESDILACQKDQPHDLNVYRACAQEFHETGAVHSSRQGRNRGRCAVHITFILTAIVFCASVATGVTPLTILSLRLTTEIDNLAVRFAEQLTNTVGMQLRNLTQPCRDVCDATHRMFSFGLLSPSLEGGLETPTVQTLYTYLYQSLGSVVGTGVSYLFVSTEYSANFMYELRGADFILWNRTSPAVLAVVPGGPIPGGQPAIVSWLSPGPGQIDLTQGPLDAINSYDPRTRPWYIAAKAGGVDSAGWTDLYTYVDGILGVTAFRALHNATGHFIGGVGADITLQGLAEYLTSEAMRLTPNMRHTVMQTSGLLIASSVPGVVVTQPTAAGAQRLSVADPQQPAELRAVVRALQQWSSTAFIDTSGELLALEGNYVFAMPLRDSFNMNWAYLMYVPIDDFLGHAKATTDVCIAICVSVMIATTVVAVLAALDLSARLRLLAVDMRRATSLMLDNIHTGEKESRVQEIQAISLEFGKLVTALRSFQKYLPQAQVGFLLSSNLEANLAAIHQQVTIMFLDIENFTGMVESLNDVAVIQFYADVMTLLTHKVLAAEGTLDKYIGDALMAFWNMPQSVPRHEEQAVQAALACRDALPALHQKGWDVDFRIGINTGMCQVGNFGSRDRLNYTAIGDNVNVASRLESLCKAYHVRILISGTTHAGLQQGLFLTRLVDKVAVKGKGGATVVHQVLGWQHLATPAMLHDCEAYAEAFQHYTTGSYSKARALWEAAAGRGDATAQVMAERLQRGVPEPGGVWRWHTK